MASQELIVQPATSRENWQTLREEAAVALKSGYLPQTIRTPEQAVAIAMAGRELGISVWRALNGINVISGKTQLSSELMADLIYRHHGGRALTVEESTATSCTISYQRKDGGERKSYTYTMAMADRAGLGTNANYKKNPDAMLRARCISAIGRMAFPDTIAGCYVEGEIADDDDSRDTRVIEHPTEPLQLPNRATNTTTGEITTPAKPADVTREELQALAATLRELAPDEDVTLPDKMTRGEARHFKQLWENAIAVARVASNSDQDAADDSFGMPEGSV